MTEYKELTKEEAIEFFQGGRWKTMSFSEKAMFQFFQPKLCMPFDVFHEAIELTLGRPVFIHEFGSAGREGMEAELLGQKEAPTMEEIINMIPEEKRILIIA